MFFSIEPNNGVPIYDQVVRQVKYAVAEGSLSPGDRVPSVRQLATQLALNPNTIARAYQQLQSDGVLETQRGLGMVVRQQAPRHCAAERQSLLAERLRGVIREATRGGLDADQLRSLFEQSLTEVAAEADQPKSALSSDQ